MTTNLGEYESWLAARGLSANTVAQRVKFARARWSDWGTWHLPPEQIASFLAEWSGWTRRTYHNHLCSLYDWLEDGGHVEVNPCRRIKRAPMPRCHARPLTKVEVAAVLKAADGDLLTWLQLARLAGLRRHEIAKLRGEELDQSGIFVLGKGGQMEVVPTHPELWRIAQSYPRRGFWFPARTSTGHVSPDVVTRQARQLFEVHGIAKSIHRLRANYGTDLLRGGANIRVVQSLMRHSSLASTQHYLADTEDERIAAISLLAA